MRRIAFGAGLAVFFLKCAGVLAWSWWWVVAAIAVPVLGPAALEGVVAVAFLIALVALSAKTVSTPRRVRP